MFRFSTLCLFACTAVCTAAMADEDDRIVTDRPDIVESSDVVALHRLQIETSLAGERARGGAQTRATPTLLRYGLAQDWELRLESEGRIVERSGIPGQASERGYADASLGLKWHVQEGKGNNPGIGVLLHVDSPSGSANLRGIGWRPSLRAVFEWELEADWSVGVMPGLAMLRNEQRERAVGGIFAIVLGKAWNARLRSFVELAAPQIARSHMGGVSTQCDVGLAYQLSPDWQVDAAFSKGLNRNSMAQAWTLGLSARF